MAKVSSPLQKKPVIAIIGATGTGKSDLAVELATRFNGEIINADAVQMYEGLPIITNKIPVEERKGVPHHLLGSIGLDEAPWTVQQFLPRTLSIIEEIRARDKLPIVIGGTHYYLQALLFQDYTIEGQTDDGDLDASSLADFEILEQPTEVILDKLREVDPVMANRWHPNDRRKIQRSLQIYLQTGQKASDVYKSRVAEESASSAGVRFPILLLWPYCEREAHKARLDRRVDRMLNQGLLDEVAQLTSFRKLKQEAGEDIDLTKGVWQAIGFRQFDPYQQAIEGGIADLEELEKLKKDALQQMQAATRRYANSQIKWIRVKLLNALMRANVSQSLFVLDGTDLQKWDETVIEPAVRITEHFLDGAELPDPPSITPLAMELLTPAKEDHTHTPENWGIQTCEVCGTKAASPQMWEKHLQSKGHRIRLSKKKARETKALVAVNVVGEVPAD